TQPPPVGAVPVCYRHPGRETYVRCTRCDRPICPDCMNEASVGHQCPECVAEGRRTQRPTRTAFGAGLAGTRGYVTITLIALNVFMMILAAASARGGNSLFGGSGFGGLLGGITPLHLWGALGPGSPTFLPLYLARGLGGSVAVFLFANPHSASAGASGAIFGLFAALFIVLKRLGR